MVVGSNPVVVIYTKEKLCKMNGFSYFLSFVDDNQNSCNKFSNFFMIVVVDQEGKI